MEYNTQRSQLKLREYGRNIEKLVSYLHKVTDESERNKKATVITKLMKIINPDINKNSGDHDRKVWDDLYIMSNFELEFEAPYPKPDPELLTQKPDRVKYSSNEIKVRHYGKTVELLIEKSISIEEEKKKQIAVIKIGRLMKSFFYTWNKETIDDEEILKTIRKLSKNQLDIDIEEVKELGLFDKEKRSGENNYKNNERNSRGRSNERNSRGRSNERNSSGRSSNERNSRGRSNERNSSGRSSNERNSSGRSSHERNSSGRSSNERNSSGRSSHERNGNGRNSSGRNSHERNGKYPSNK